MESSPQPPNLPTTETRPHGIVFVGGVWMIVLALLLLLCGLCSSLFYIILPLTTRNPARELESNVFFGALAGLGLVFGAVLVWQGLITVRGGASFPSARAFPPLPVFVFAFIGALLVGLGALVVQPAAVYVFPPWHFVAAVLPPLAFLAYAARRLGTMSGLRALVVSFGWGALAAPTAAVVLEVGVGLVLVVIAAIVLSFIPNGRALLEQLQVQLQSAERTGNPTALLELAANPIVSASLLFYFAVIVPLLEEMVKALVVAFIDPRRTRLADALLWGIGAGAGFAAVENLFNASVGLSTWAVVMLLRVGAATMHIANGATMGRGWYAARVERRWGGLVVAYGMSVLYHALWNGAAILLGTRILVLTGQASARLEELLLASALLIVLALLLSGGLVWIVYQVRAAQRASAAAA